MTTPNVEQLIVDVQKQLAHHQHHSFFERDWRVADNLKALLGALEAQAREIELLAGYRDRALELATAYNNAQENIEQISTHRDHILRVNDKLSAELEAIRAQQAVCVVGSHWNSGGGFDVHSFTSQPAGGTKLYAAIESLKG